MQAEEAEVKVNEGTKGGIALSARVATKTAVNGKLLHSGCPFCLLLALKLLACRHQKWIGIVILPVT